MATSKEAADAAIGPIRSDELYPLVDLKRRAGLSVAALRQARRKGLRVQYIGRRGFVLGSDLIEYAAQSSDRVGAAYCKLKQEPMIWKVAGPHFSRTTVKSCTTAVCLTSRSESVVFTRKTDTSNWRSCSAGEQLFQRSWRRHSCSRSPM